MKLSKIRLKNVSGEARKFRIYGYAEWVLGNNPARTAPFVLSTFDEETGALLASNPYEINYPGRFAFLAGPEQPDGYTASRREFIGRHGTIKLPQAVARASGLTGSIESESDPCAAIAFDIELAPGQSRDMTFLLGETDTADGAVDLVKSVRAAGFETVLKTNRDFWTGFTGKLSVDTGDKAFDNLVNRWLPYQALACRIFARARVLPGEWCIRLPRPVAGYACLPDRRAAAGPPPDRQGCGPSVRRRRCPALVVAADRRGCPHHDLG